MDWALWAIRYQRLHAAREIGQSQEVERAALPSRPDSAEDAAGHPFVGVIQELSPFVTQFDVAVLRRVSVVLVRSVTSPFE